MTHIELKAQQLRQQAQKKMNSGGFLKTLFSKSNQIQESIEYYIRAANLFKMAKNWSQAGFAFSDAADLNFRDNNCMEAAANFVEAGNCFKRCDSTKAVEYYLKAIDIYCDKGKFVMAAKHHQIIAELLEDEYDLDEAIVHYEKAAEFYKQECNFSSGNKCLEKIAEYAALSGDYHRAINIFQEIACFDLASSVLKYCAKHYLFRAAVCLLCSETDVRSKLQTYVNMHPAFEDSREYQLIICILECIEHGNSEGLWHITMLHRIKNQIANYPDLK
ncbi:hypothetical protein NQ315_015659 [Exocentrus adspersus]|uniref:Alpha-soluble NSF attachment protein n=1 Tax=Exocentrus adspersus TaxID=1586481 RepID=A0AAV8W2H5_9CUCU|nr:hypothetical protein NQ315_015659 [Exocentrus adspersus]